MAKGEADLQAIKDLFAKYKKNLVAPESSVINAFVEVVDDLLGIQVNKKLVRYQPGSGTLFISKSGPLKTEIQLHQKEIINHLKGRLGPKNAPKTIL